MISLVINLVLYMGTLPKKHKTENPRQSNQKKITSKANANLTIKNYLGGNYFFTCDKFKIEDKNVYLIENKHSQK